MTLNVGEIVRVTVFYTAPGASVANSVFNFDITTFDTEEEDLIDAVDGWLNDVWAAEWSEIASNEATCESYSVDHMNPDGTVEANLGVGDIETVGLNGESVCAAGVSAYLLAQTPNPKQRGSKYVPFLSELTVDSGVIATAAITDLSILLLSYLATINISGGGKLRPGVLSRSLVAFIPFLAQGVVNDIPAYQRRRKAFVGS